MEQAEPGKEVGTLIGKDIGGYFFSSIIWDAGSRNCFPQSPIKTALPRKKQLDLPSLE